MNLVTRDRPQFGGSDGGRRRCNRQTATRAYINEHVIARAVTSSEWLVGLVVVCIERFAAMYENRYKPYPSGSDTAYCASHYQRQRDHAACVLRVSYCGPEHKRRTKTAFNYVRRGDRSDEAGDLERVDKPVYLRTSSTLAHPRSN